MATALSDVPLNEFNDFITCGVCFCQFDDESRKPKFLPCSHTLCLYCIRGILCAGKLTCPFCRNVTLQSLDVQILPSNSYALQMVKLLKKKDIPPVDLKATKSTNWCFTCGSVGKSSCSIAEHCLFDMTADTWKNIEAFVGLKEGIKKKSNQGTDKLAMALEKRKQINKHFDDLITFFTQTLDEIHELQDQNNIQMAELASLIENEMSNISDDPTDSSEGSSDSFILDLKSLADSLSPGDTAETLQLKLNKFLRTSEEKLAAATSDASKYEAHKILKLTVNLHDENDLPVPTCAPLQGGFQLLKPNGSDGLSFCGREARRKLSLLSYLVYSLIHKPQKQGAPITSEAEAVVADGSCPAIDRVLTELFTNHPSLSSSSSVSAPPLPSQPPPSLKTLPRRSFVFGQSIFKLKIFKSNIAAGEVHIRSYSGPASPKFQSFLTKLGNMCFNSPKPFSKTITKAVSNVFVLIPSEHPSFTPNADFFPDIENPTKKASSINEVGLMVKKSGPSTNSTCSGWSFVFPLCNYQIPKFKMHVKDLAANHLFGTIVASSNPDPFVKLSASIGPERELFSMTIESC